MQNAKLIDLVYWILNSIEFNWWCCDDDEYGWMDEMDGFDFKI